MMEGHKTKHGVIYTGDCLDVMKKIPDESVDSIVTDPPAGISFQNYEWDSDRGGRDKWISWMREVATECYRALKPGAHALVWSLPRTSHWTAMAWENAGFRVRDKISHIYGTGTPKGVYIHKEIKRIYKQSTSKWEGWATGLKPAREDWLLLRKPISEKSIARNVVKYGTGAINIDKCRVPLNGEAPPSGSAKRVFYRNAYCKNSRYGRNMITPEAGRYPSNVILDGSKDVTSLFPITKSGSNCTRRKPGTFMKNGGIGKPGDVQITYGDAGSASRVFMHIARHDDSVVYCPKPTAKERDLGIRRDDNETSEEKNIHGTVKPIKLIRYLCRLITPPGGIVLDPFIGTGTTAMSCIYEGLKYIGIEIDAEYSEIAKKRISHALETIEEETTQTDIFEDSW